MVLGPSASVSVIIPVYNGEKYLAEAIRSVLAQEYSPVEVIVIDDGSTDGSAKIARSFLPVRYCRQPNGGVGAAVNRGLALAGGDFLGFLDADDVWTGGRIERQMEALRNDPGVEAVFGLVEQFTSPDPGGGSPPPVIMPGCHKGSMLIRREAFFRVGLFDPRWRYGDFVDWYARAQEAGLRIRMINHVVLRRRIHGDNMGIRERQNRVSYARILKAAMDRRRGIAPSGAAGPEGNDA